MAVKWRWKWRLAGGYVAIATRKTETAIMPENLSRGVEAMRQRRQHWGRGNRANYDTKMVRVPLPVLAAVQAAIEAFHQENDLYLALPTHGAWWEVLGVSPGASQEEIKEAYRNLARLYHPDTNQRRDARQRFEAVTRAYKEACKLFQ